MHVTTNITRLASIHVILQEAAATKVFRDFIFYSNHKSFPTQKFCHIAITRVGVVTFKK